MGERIQMVDSRQPRFGQAITGGVLLLGYLADVPLVIPILATVLAAASLFGPRLNPYAYLYRAFARLVRLRPPRELEEAAPPRFANTVGFLVLTAASVAAFGFDPPLAGGWVAWGMSLLVSALALLAAITGLCLGCELYVVARRVLTRGRVSQKLVVERDQPATTRVPS